MSFHSGTVGIRALALSTLLSLAACGSPTTSAATSSMAPRAEISSEQTATAQVIAIDKGARMVTLRSEDGRLLDVQAGEAVRNFDQLSVGDTVRATYKLALSATLLPATEPMSAPTAGVTASRARVGAQPGAGLGATVSMRVRVVSVDTAQEIVVGSLASGELVAHRVATPQGREFVKQLKSGDLVQLDYSEAVALSVEPVKPAKG